MADPLVDPAAPAGRVLVYEPFMQSEALDHLSLRGDLTITHADGRTETVQERSASSGGRSYWGVSHELLIADFYARLHEPEPFWISPREALKALRIVKDVYRQSFPELGDAVA